MAHQARTFPHASARPGELLSLRLAFLLSREFRAAQCLLVSSYPIIPYFPTRSPRHRGKSGQESLNCLGPPGIAARSCPTRFPPDARNLLDLCRHVPFRNSPAAMTYQSAYIPPNNTTSGLWNLLRRSPRARRTISSPTSKKSAAVPHLTAHTSFPRISSAPRILIIHLYACEARASSLRAGAMRPVSIARLRGSSAPSLSSCSHLQPTLALQLHGHVPLQIDTLAGHDA